ncbi:hypothetical protein [uncultured Lactobacillus sp.]|uniref:hypothetical protein n=1 Tax=uncultured Lactobacillus sp. TaxID=153152 RepID=UPI002803A942|nr:hypothetical protein [uncultured Lactobacillus sp.]
MDFCYQIGIFIGFFFIGLSLRIFKGCRKSGYPSNMTNFAFSMLISMMGVFIVVASLAAIQPHNWYTSSAIWKMLVTGNLM